MEFETYADVIDAYNADNMGYSTLTDYIKDQNIKIKEIEMDPIGDMRRIFESKADGGSIGIEVLFKEKMANGGRVPAISGGFMKFLAEGAAKGKQGIMELIETGKGKIADFAETQANKKMFRSADDIPPTSISQAKGPMTIEMMEAVDDSIVNKLLNTQRLGLYEETPEILKAANLLERFTKKVKGKRVIDYERAESILGVPLKGDETINDLFRIEFETRPVEKMADGGRVGLFMGGPALEGQALDVYTSMNAYGFSDQEIADALAARGLYGSGNTTTTTPVTNTAPNIINQGGSGDNEPPSGPTYNRDDDLTTSDYQGTGPGLLEGLLSIPGNVLQAYVKNSPVINFARDIFKPKFERINKINFDAVVRAEEERKAKAAAERAAFLAEAQRTGIANQLGGPDGTSGGKYAGGASFASANPYGGSGTMNDLGADNFKKGGLATMFTRRR